MTRSRRVRNRNRPQVEEEGNTPRRAPREADESDDGSQKEAAKDAEETTHKEMLDESSTGNLYNVVQSGKDIESTIDSCLTEFEIDPVKTKADLYQLLISASGCATVVHSYEEESFSKILEKLTKIHAKDSDPYPLIRPVEGRKLSHNLPLFLSGLVARANDKVLYEMHLLSLLVEFLFEMSRSKYRPFRHTSTLAALKLVKPLLEMKSQLEDSKRKTEQQVENAEARQARGEHSSPDETMKQLCQEYAQKIAALDQVLGVIVDNIFGVRNIDVASDIRLLCVEDLANWMNFRPDIYLQDKYLKPFGRGLNEEDPAIRHRCLESLLSLVDNGENLSELEAFIKPRRSRLSQMIMDIEMVVAIKACYLLARIHSTFPVLLEAKEVESAYIAVYSQHREWAISAGELIVARLKYIHRPNTTSSTEVHSGEREASEMVLELASLHAKNKCNGKVAYLVDALIDTASFLREWQAYTQVLTTMTDLNKPHSALVEILHAVVKQLSTGEHPLGRSIAKRYTGKEQRQISEEKDRLSIALIPVLPGLLAKFIDHDRELALLLDIPTYFNLDLYSTCGREEHVRELASTLQRVFNTSGDDEVLGRVAKLFDFLPSNADIHEQIRQEIEKVDFDVGHSVSAALERFEGEKLEALNGDEEKMLLFTFRKLDAFATIFPSTQERVWDAAYAVLTNPDKYDCPELADKAIRVLFMTLCWDLKTALIDGTIKPGTAERIVARRDQFVKCVKDIIYNGSSGLESAFTHICETLMMFNWKLAHRYANDEKKRELVQYLPLKLNDDFNARLVNYVVDMVFENVYADDPMEEREEWDEEEDKRLEEKAIEKREAVLYQYIQLIIYGVLPIIEAAPIFRYYTEAFSERFDEPFKLLFTKCFQLDPITTAKTIALSLIESYEGVKASSTNEVVNPTSHEFESVKRLACRLSSFFVADTGRGRESMVMVHMDGIDYALGVRKSGGRRRKAYEGDLEVTLKNLPFLEIVTMFSPRLAQQDRAPTALHLEKHCPVKPEPSDDEENLDPAWRPYVNYKRSLLLKKK